MNILPKKKWHVRTSENIARVRRDEAKAAEEAKELERRIKLAEQEARVSLLREKAKLRGGDTEESLAEPKGNTESSVVGPSGHINFFQQLEDGEEGTGTNKEHEEEKKKEQEEYEKKVGYLTYLGQDTEELTGESVWWKKLPRDRAQNVEEEKRKDAVKGEHKDFLDPLKDVRKYLKCDGVRLTLKKHEKKINKIEDVALTYDRKRKRSRSRSRSKSPSRRRSKKRKKESERKKRKKSKSKKSKRKKSYSSSSSSSDSDDAAEKAKKKLNLERLRRERLEREKAERSKADKLLFGDEKDSKEKEKVSTADNNQKYNSQFNPHLAKQNKLDPSQKYWLM